MATVMLGWELGNGTGYCQRLLTIAHALAARGHTPVLVLYDLIGTHHLLKDCPFPTYQAPILKGLLNADNPHFVPTSYADILLCDRFAEPDVMLSVLRVWDQLFDVIQPDFVFGEYAPAMMVASYGRFPRAVMGNGYIAPPMERSWFPAFRTDIEPFGKQADLKAGLDQVQRQRGRPVAANLTDYFSGLASYVYCYDILDPYQSIRQQKPIGPLSSPPVFIPPPNKRRFHAYLTTSYPGWLAVVEGLFKSGLAGTLYMPNIPQSVRGLAKGSAVEITDIGPPLAQAVAAADVVVHHGGIDTTQMALLMGRPQLLFPRYIEQRLNAAVLSKFKVGLHPSVLQFDYRLSIGAVNILLDPDKEYGKNALELSKRLYETYLTGSLEVLIDSIDFQMTQAVKKRAAGPNLPGNILS